MSQRQQVLVELQDGIWILPFVRHIMRLVAGGNRQPGLSLAEARMGRIIPLHGRAFAVPSLFLGPPRFSLWILHIFLARGVVVLHPDLFAVIHDGRAAQREIEASQHFRDLIIMLSVAVTVIRAHLVVIAYDKNRPTAGGLDRCNLLAKFRRREFVYSGEHEI